MARIDDEQIKSLINRYQQTDDGYQQIVEMMAEYIFNFPRIKYNQSDEVCSDFFIYFFERLAKLIKKYQVQECQFISWLNLVLMRQYFNWARKNQKKSLKNIVYVEDFIDQSHHRQQDKETSSTDLEIKRKVIKETINSLPKKVKIAIKLHFFDFFDGEDLIEISQIFKVDFHILIEKYEKILSLTIPQYEKEQELLDNLNTNFSKLSYCREKLNLLEEEELVKNQPRLLKKVDQYQQRHQKTVSQFRRFHITVKSEYISDFLGVNINAIHNLIYRGKVLLREKLLEAKLC